MSEKTNKAMQSLELQMALDNMKEFLPLFIERCTPNAKIRKAKYEALLKEGFTEAQAIEIVSKSPIIE